MDEFEIKDTMGGVEIRLPAAEGQRRFAEVVLTDEQGGMTLAWYDTEGMVIDAQNHIRPVDRQRVRTGRDMLDLLRARGIELVAAVDGKPAQVEVMRGAFMIDADENDNDADAAAIRFPTVGPMKVTVGGSERQVWDWRDVRMLLSEHGVDLRAVPAGAADSATA
jgi:hypothetical protein